MDQFRPSNPVRYFYVGKKAKMFVVEERVLRGQCLLFQKLHEQTQEQQDILFDKLRDDIHRQFDGLYLPSVDPDSFQRLTDYLYQGLIPPVTPAWIMEQKLYYLADVLGATELMNGLVDALQEYQSQTNTHFTIFQVRSILPILAGSSIWRYCLVGIASQLAWGLFNARDKVDLEHLYLEYPHVSADINMELLKSGEYIHKNVDYRRCSGSSGAGFGPCEFHVHPPGAVCAAQRERGFRLKAAKRQGTQFMGPYAVVSKEEVKQEPGLGALSIPTFQLRAVAAHHRHPAGTARVTKRAGRPKAGRPRLAGPGRARLGVSRPREPPRQSLQLSSRTVDPSRCQQM